MRRETIRLSLAVTAITIMATGVLIFPISSARAADAARGRLLYENECMVCHTSVVHIREDRKAQSRDEIRGWVQRWSKELKLQWESGDIDDVIEYLNDKYYQLKITS
jgi:hypothetical protein